MTNGPEKNSKRIKTGKMEKEEKKQKRKNVSEKCDKKAINVMQCNE